MTFKEAYLKFSRDSTFLINSLKTIRIKPLFQLIINEYLKTDIDGIDENNSDRDMLLFEYENYDKERNLMKFKLSMKRQVLLDGFDERGAYGFTIYYKNEKIEQINRYSKWCINKNLINEWKSKIEETDRFKIIESFEFERIEFELEKPN